jgi:CBS domain-containing protein
MAATSGDAQIRQELAASQTPAERFRELSTAHQRDVFFQFPETLQRSVVADMNAVQLRQFVRRLDRDEATDVLGLAENADHTLLGVLPGPTLAMTEEAIDDITAYVRRTPAVRYDATETDVVELVREHPEGEIAVLDDDDSILGVIYAEDLLRLVEAEAGETLYEFTGVAEEESVLDGPVAKAGAGTCGRSSTSGRGSWRRPSSACSRPPSRCSLSSPSTCPSSQGWAATPARSRWQSPSVASRWVRCRSRPAPA